MARDDGLPPRALAAAIRELRIRTLALLDALSDAELEVEALPARGGSPAWTVADVLRHLAATDRRSVLVVHLARFRAGQDLDDFEDANDRDLERLRGRSRQQLRAELQRWGRALAAVVAVAPGPVARLRVTTAFGRLPLAWLAALRLYDEWVHQHDIAAALARPEPPMPAGLAELLAAFQLLAIAGAPPAATGPRTPVTVEVGDAGGVPARTFPVVTPSADGPGEPTRVVVDAAALCLVAADRVPWRTMEAAGRITCDGNREAAATLLDTVRVV